MSQNDSTTAFAPRFSGRHNRRFVLQAGAAAAMTAALLPSRFARPALAANDISGAVTMWVYPLLEGDTGGDETMWAGIAEKFNAEYPNVQVTVQVQPWSRRVEQLVAAMAANAGPDVWYINIEDIPNHANAGRLVALDDILSSESKDDYLPNAISAMSYDGKLWAAPILMGATTTFYNTKLFADAGVTTYPATWDEVKAAGQAFKDKGQYLIQYDATNSQAFFYPLLWQAGGQPYNEDGTIAFNSPEGVEALTFVTDLFTAGYAPAAAATAEGIPITESPLGLGQVAMGIGLESSALKQLNAAWGEGALKIGEPLKNKEQASFGTVAGYAISEKSASKDAAAAWVQFITSPEIMTEINQKSGFFAPRKSVGKIHEGDPILGALEDQLSFVRATPAVLGGRQVLSDALSPEIQAAVLGEKTPQKALDDAAATATSILKEQAGG